MGQREEAGLLTSSVSTFIASSSSEPNGGKGMISARVEEAGDQVSGSDMRASELASEAWNRAKPFSSYSANAICDPQMPGFHPPKESQAGAELLHCELILLI